MRPALIAIYNSADALEAEHQALEAERAARQAGHEAFEAERQALAAERAAREAAEVEARRLREELRHHGLAD